MIQQLRTDVNPGMMCDADPGQQGPVLCVVAAIDKYSCTTEILWRKRDSMAALLSERG